MRNSYICFNVSMIAGPFALSSMTSSSISGYFSAYDNILSTVCVKVIRLFVAAIRYVSPSYMPLSPIATKSFSTSPLNVASTLSCKYSYFLRLANTSAGRRSLSVSVANSSPSYNLNHVGSNVLPAAPVGLPWYSEFHTRCPSAAQTSFFLDCNHSLSFAILAGSGGSPKCGPISESPRCLPNGSGPSAAASSSYSHGKFISFHMKSDQLSLIKPTTSFSTHLVWMTISLP